VKPGGRRSKKGRKKHYFGLATVVAAIVTSTFGKAAQSVRRLRVQPLYGGTGILERAAPMDRDSKIKETPERGGPGAARQARVLDRQ
jgi:hypothetical protein